MLYGCVLGPLQCGAGRKRAVLPWDATGWGGRGVPECGARTLVRCAGAIA